MQAIAEAVPDSIPLVYAGGVEPDPLTPEQFRAWRERLGLSQSDVGHALGVTATAVWRWENKKRELQPMVSLAMCEVERRVKAQERRRNSAQ